MWSADKVEWQGVWHTTNSGHTLLNSQALVMSLLNDEEIRSNFLLEQGKEGISCS